MDCIVVGKTVDPGRPLRDWFRYIFENLWCRREITIIQLVHMLKHDLLLSVDKQMLHVGICFLNWGRFGVDTICQRFAWDSTALCSRKLYLDDLAATAGNSSVVVHAIRPNRMRGARKRWWGPGICGHVVKDGVGFRSGNTLSPGVCAH